MDEHKDQTILKEATFKKWKEKFPCLIILSIGQQKKMICKICTNQEEKLKQMAQMNLTFLNGSTKFKMSTPAEHESTDSHTRETEGEKNSKPLLQVNQYQCVKLH